MKNIKGYIMNAIKDYDEVKHLTDKQEIINTLDNYIEDDEFLMGDYKSIFARFILEDDKYHITEQIDIYDDDGNVLYNDDIEKILLEI